MIGKASIPDGTRVYAIGDIHGRADLLRSLHAMIAADAAQAPAERHVLVHLGDYIDRGPASAEVIEILIGGGPAGFECVNLKGNHDDYLLRFHDHGEWGENWLMNGGGPTLASYGVSADGDTFQALWNLPEIRETFVDKLPAAHLAFFRSLGLWHREGDYLFVHAGLRPGQALEDQDPADLIWIRDDFLYSDADFGRVVVHGHTPRPEPVVRDNRIGIDTMAYRSDRLTCLVLEGRRRRFLAT